MSVIIKNLKITNFRSCQQTSIALDKFSACIGYNNAGKSNIILALKFLLSGGARNFPFSVNAFNQQKPISIEAELTGITPEHLQLLEPDHANKLSKIMNSGVLRIKRESSDGDYSKSKYELKVYYEEKSDWGKLPTGIDNSIVKLFPNLIHIQAMTDASEDSTKSKSSTTIGQLLELIAEEIKENNKEQFSRSLDILKELLDCESEKRIDDLGKTDDRINTILQDYFPDISVKVDFPIPDISDIFKVGTLKVFDNHLFSRDFNQFGHGTQRSIQMALIQYLAELTQLSKDTKRSNTFICIDEPELYLHPHAINCVRDSLHMLEEKGYQILITTHSPMILSAESSMNAIQIYKHSELGTQARITVKQCIESSTRVAQLRDIFKYNNSAIIFFHEFVLLGEGKTETRLLPGIFSQVMKSHFHLLKVGIIETAGKLNLLPISEVIKNLGIPTLIVADLDYVAECIKVEGLIEEEHSRNLIDVIKRLNSVHKLGLESSAIEKNSLTKIGAKGFKKVCGYEEFTVSIAPIRAELKKKNIFIWGMGDIEAITELGSKSESEWQAFNCSLAKEQDTLATLGNYKSIIEFCEWIKEKTQKDKIAETNVEEQEV